MPEFSRRSFLGGALVVIGATAIPSALRGKPAPVIWGDGVHDDGPGFRAALAGEPFICAHEGMVLRKGGGLMLSEGHFRFTDTLDLSAAKVPATIVGSRLSFHDMPKGQRYAIDARNGAATHHLSCCHIEGNGHSTGVIMGSGVIVTQRTNGNWDTA